MIITRTPLRITLGGGGTDLPGYYREHGSGFLVAAAITKYVYIAVNHNFDGDLLLKYSSVERVPEPAQVRHPLLREILLTTGVSSDIEISSMADIPAGTGLGSSGAFTVGALKALSAHKHELASNVELAELACHIEIERLSEPIGKQDQYIAAVGGITSFEFRDDDTVEIAPLELAAPTRHALHDNLLLFYTGIRRAASDVLAVEQNESLGRDRLDANLHAVRALGHETADALVRGDLSRFGELLTEQWELKLTRSPTPTHKQVDEWIREGIAAGSAGGKLVGAGDGGFLLFYAENKVGVREAMADQGLAEVRFDVDYLGTTVIVSG
ncbi:MAG TPA: galactokinase [Acidimicrobiia bacterium]|jgi:D-glycero-alpha-D-manno-heptose-7-phosphate kinase